MKKVKIAYWVKKEVEVNRTDLIAADRLIRDNMDITDETELEPTELIQGLMSMGIIKDEFFDTKDETTISPDELETIESFGDV